MTQPGRGIQIAVLFGLACIALAVCYSTIPAALVAGEWLPVGHDSFYHARRIQDVLAGDFSNFEFDRRIHAPEGSWVTWPWAYDLGMAAIAAVIAWMFGLDNPMVVAAHVAPAWVLVNGALVWGIARRINLPPGLALFAVLAFCLSPLMRGLHGVGILDHHFIELSFMLAMVHVGLGWARDPTSRRQACLLGGLLGAAPAFHNGLFALQLPVLLFLLLLWLRGNPLGREAMYSFAASLVVATLLAVLPAASFRNLQFTMATLSVFHLYVAAAGALQVVLMASGALSSKRLAAMVLVGLACLLPVAGDVVVGSRFLASDLQSLGTMAEAQNLLAMVRQRGFAGVFPLYSGLVLFIPLLLAWQAVVLLRSADRLALFVACTSLFGLVLACFQFRLFYFGLVWLLVLPPLAIHLAALHLEGGRRRLALVAGCAVFASAIGLGWTGLQVKWPPANSYSYGLSWSIFPVLKQVCDQSPGIVLADQNDGHYITYRSNCRVISNNFILTRQHEEKIRLSARLLAMDAEEMLSVAPWIDYVFVRRHDNLFAPGSSLESSANPRLARALLAARPIDSPRLKLVAEIRLGEPGGDAMPYARLYRVVGRD